MSGIGPVEPGEGTRARRTGPPEAPYAPCDSTTPDGPYTPQDPHNAHSAHRPLAPAPPFQRRYPAAGLRAHLRAILRARPGDHPRSALLTAAALAALLTCGGLLYATREQRPPHPAPPLPAPPYPSQVVDVSYLEPAATPPGAPPGSFSFALLVSVESGPPVTVTALDQPYAGLSLTSAPRPPFRTAAGSAHKIVITMHVMECGKVPENAGLPFLDVTLRNIRAMEVQSFILGSRYAHALSEALQVACGNVSR
ncbi:hypothetical protein [Streptomyces sp. NPDC093260]|uniref:hypothetical protein n=1 Tax=Streptomyces sp. NPDC093260 TaxID=3155073 RepID=UPI00341A07BF